MSKTLQIFFLSVNKEFIDELRNVQKISEYALETDERHITRSNKIHFENQNQQAALKTKAKTETKHTAANN